MLCDCGGTHPFCDRCGGTGYSHCCEGEQAQPWFMDYRRLDGRRTDAPADSPPRDPGVAEGASSTDIPVKSSRVMGVGAPIGEHVRAQVGDTPVPLADDSEAGAVRGSSKGVQ